MGCGPRQAHRPRCASRKADGLEWTLEDLIEAYQADYEDDRVKGDRWWAQAPSPEEALVRAFYDWEEGSGPPRRILNSHQFRIGYSTVAKAAIAAARHMPRLMAAEDFDQLLAAFQTIWTIEEVFSDATLLTYDVAERFGRYRNIHPAKVYLHAGAEAGARALGVQGQAPEAQAFGPVLGRLPPSEIENFLCICKSQLRPGMLGG